MTSRGEFRAFVAAALALWLLFVVQALHTPVLLDDWFQLRYWRDHEMGLTSIWEYARHNYFNYNPRIGEVFLAVIDGSTAVHLIVTPLVQVAVLPTVFVIAFARWPRATLRDLQLLLFIQTMIWLVIPIPGIMYFYRPIATNYLWAFTITLALFVPYRLALAGSSTKSRAWLVPIMFVLGWVAGMCNEHTGPTAMIAMAGFVYVAWRMYRLRAWMIAGMAGLFIGYPMLFFAPGQAVRYGGIATRDTPAKLLADRGVLGCLGIVRDFIHESRLAILVFVAAIVHYLLTIYARGGGFPTPPPRRSVSEAALLASGAGAIVLTLVASPTATDRVFYAPGVLLVAAFAIGAHYLFAERVVRRVVVGACICVFGYHVVRFVDTYVTVKADSDERLAILSATPPGAVAVVPTLRLASRSRWHIGDDLHYYPWLRDYIGGELFDLARVDLDRRERAKPPRLVAQPVYDRMLARAPSLASPPTYRQLQTPAGRFALATQIGSQLDDGLIRFTVTALGVYDDPRYRPTVVLDWTPAGYRFVGGRPYDEARGHFIRVQRASMPAHVESTHIIGCGHINKVEPLVEGDDVLVPVDERYCRGPFTAVMCEPDRCWVAGWY